MPGMRIAPFVLLVTLSLAAAQVKPMVEPSPEPPPDKPKAPQGPILARLIAKKTTYLLDRQGMTPEKYRAAVRAGKIAPPEVDLVLELINTSTEELRVRVAGAAPKLTLDLKGKDVLTRSATRTVRPKLTYQVLKPGEKYEIPLTRLAGFQSSAKEDQVFWTEPGEYMLSATFRTYIYKNMPVVANPAGRVVRQPAARTTIMELKTDPIQISVRAK